MSIGSNFSKGMDTAEIARRIRMDIREAQRAGTISKLVKTAVRISRYSGGASITINVLDAPFLVVCPHYVAAAEANPHVHIDMHRWTARARQLLEQLEAIAEEYRHDASDPVTDYVNVNFFLTVRLDGALERGEREMILEAIRACPQSEVRP